MITGLEEYHSALLFVLSHWNGLLFFVLAYLALEFMEHSKEGRWPEEWTIFGWNIGRRWMNTPTAYKNKDEFGGTNRFLDFLFEKFLVPLTDAEHLFQFLMFVFIGIGTYHFTKSDLLGWSAFLCLAMVGGVFKAIIKKLFPKMNLT